MKNKFVLIVIGIVVFYFFLRGVEADKRNEANSRNSTSTTSKEEIDCMVCGKDLTDDYNRIQPNGKGYYCTPCYKQTMRDIHDEMRAEGYD